MVNLLQCTGQPQTMKKYHHVFLTAFNALPLIYQGIPGGSDGKDSRRPRFNPWVGKIPWRRKWQPTPALLPGEFHGQRNLVGYGPWDCKELAMTEVTNT